jgi:signal transduction histidine kinase/CheY-like chemotaxis protein
MFASNISHATPQQAVILDDKIAKFSLATHLEVLEDPGRSLSIQHVSSPAYSTQFTPNTQSVANFGRTHSAYWVRFTLNNQSELKWYMRINALLGHDVALHVFGENGKEVTQQVALYLPNYGLHAWSLRLPSQESLQFYLRATNGDSIFSLPLELFTSDDFVEQTRLDHNLYVSILAALLLMFVYNLISFFVLRERGNLALAIHSLSVAAILHSLNPVYNGFNFLQDTDSHFFTAPIYICVLSFLFFCQELLQTSTRVPILNRLILGVAFFSVALIFVTGWIPRGTLLPQLMLILSISLVTVASIKMSLRGCYIAKYCLLIFIIIILIVIPNVVINLVAETQWDSAKSYLNAIGTVVFLLLLSIVQSLKVREWREKEQFVAVSKEATDNFLMTISHELRTPMHSLIGIGELLKGTELNSEQKNYLNKQENAAQHMMELINDILKLGGMSSGSQTVDLVQEPFELQGLLDDLNQLMSVPAQDKGLALVITSVPSICPTLLGDAKHLKQVLINLLDNAIKSTERGTVSLRVGLKKDDDLSLMTAFFEINDTGFGIPEDKQPYLFQPFYQVKHSDQQRSGSGLGLAISHQLVTLMGGELQLRNQLKVGSSFFFTLNLPIREEIKHPEIEVSGEKTKLLSLQGLRILFVDDDSLNLFVGQKLLTSKGAEVLLASTGEDAIRQVREQSCDLVLMDLSLPDMDGYEAARHIRADKSIPNCTIIALTAHAIGEEREKSLQSGMDDYLAKPYSIDALVEIILKNRAARLKVR